MEDNEKGAQNAVSDEELEKLVLEELRGRWLEEDNGYFTGEIFADYRDQIDGRTAGEIIDDENPEEEFWSKLQEWHIEAEIDCENDLMKEVKKSLAADGNHFPDGLDEDQEQFVEDFIRDHVSFQYPAGHYLDQELCVNIMVDTGDMNYDFVLNSVYPCWYGDCDSRINDKAAIVWLAKTQGYTKTQLWKALKEGDMAEPKGFLQSMRVELANLQSHMSTVTFLVKMTFRQLIELNEAIRWRDKQNGRQYDPAGYPYSGYIVLGKETMCGLYDPWDGGGSVLEVELEKDVRLPIKYIWLAIPDEAKGHGYQVGDVYGMCESAWRDSLKELHIPKKIREVA